MIYVIYFIHVVISLFLILVVLLQQGKGADLSFMGGGNSQAAFGARGTASVLHKATVACFVGFILTTASIGILQSRGTSSVMSGVAPEATQSDTEGASELAGGELPPEGETTEATPATGASEPPEGEVEAPAEDGSEAGEGAPEVDGEAASDASGS